MPAYTNVAAQTYHSGGANLGSTYKETRREWLMDQIAIVNPVETPLLSTLSKIPIDNTFFEWGMDDITDPRDGTINATAEAAQFDPDVRPFRIRAGNYSHIIANSFMISDSQRRANEIGTSDEYSYQVWRQFLALAKEFEYALCWSAGSAGAVGTARQTHGMFAWAINTGIDASDATILGRTIPQAYSATYKTGTGADITADEFNADLLGPAWDQGMELSQSLMFCGAKLKLIISRFPMVYAGSGATLSATPLNERNIPAMSKELIDTIDVYQTSFGTIYVNKSRYMNGAETFASFAGETVTITPNSTLLIFEPRFFAIGVYEGFHLIPLARTGLTSQAAVAAQLGLICRNPKAMIAGHDLAA